MSRDTCGLSDAGPSLPPLEPIARFGLPPVEPGPHFGGYLLAMALLLLRTTLATLLAFAGGAVGVALSGAERHLRVWVYAAMGALLAVTCFDVLPDAKTLLSWPAFLLATASGTLLFYLVGHYVAHICPSCALDSFDDAALQRLSQSVVLLMVALGLHSAMDGIAVVVGDTLTGRPNFAVLMAVGLHKVPEGMALALLLRGAGYAPRRALLCTCGIESATELGGLVGVLCLRHAPLHTLGLVFAHVGGGFLYLVASTLGLTARRRSFAVLRMPQPALVLSASLAFAATAGLIWGLRAYAP